MTGREGERRGGGASGVAGLRVWGAQVVLFSVSSIASFGIELDVHL